MLNDLRIGLNTLGCIKFSVKVDLSKPIALTDLGHLCISCEEKSDINSQDSDATPVLSFLFFSWKPPQTTDVLGFSQPQGSGHVHHSLYFKWYKEYAGLLPSSVACVYTSKLTFN